ncbi:MAG: adenosylcobinamide-GDP ribazoletransferase [Gallionellaceae bacterium]|jgi:adenosylcobinamide-GDP ribazoletransferase|nr:adenosylcobinamide-GDP ribazoletransferase [Gallionellaceae bacterium]
MLQELRLFLTAVQFFTRIPAPAWVGHSAQQLEQAARYFPLVGVCIGALSAAVLWLGAQALPLPLAAGLSIAASILATGAFHEDGLSDFADGMGGGHSKEKVLAIMKDSRVGVYGVIALVLVLLLKYQALLELCSEQSPLFVAAALIAAHAISRLMAASIMLAQRYVRDDDSARAKPAAQKISRASFAIASLTGIAATGLLFAAGAHPASVFIAVAAAFMMRAYLAARLQKRLGGYTGDCLGAVQQLSELAFYLGLLINI